MDVEYFSISGYTVVAAGSNNEKRVRAGSLGIGLAVMLQKPEQRCRLQEIQEVFDQVKAVYLDTSNAAPLREVCTKQVQKDEDPQQRSKVPRESQSRSIKPSAEAPKPLFDFSHNEQSGIGLTVDS
jgi:hypothetical protein